MIFAGVHLHYKYIDLDFAISLKSLNSLRSNELLWQIEVTNMGVHLHVRLYCCYLFYTASTTTKLI